MKRVAAGLSVALSTLAPCVVQASTLAMVLRAPGGLDGLSVSAVLAERLVAMEEIGADKLGAYTNASVAGEAGRGLDVRAALFSLTSDEGFIVSVPGAMAAGQQPLGNTLEDLATTTLDYGASN